MRPTYIRSLSDLDVLTLTVWAEARGESEEGQRAVAYVILNRVVDPKWWSREKEDGIPDDTVAAVCLRSKQFSCWNVGTDSYKALLKPSLLNDAKVLKIKALCEKVMQDYPDGDPTHGATHYCTHAVAPTTSWAKNRKPLVSIGNHRFFKD